MAEVVHQNRMWESTDSTRITQQASWRATACKLAILFVNVYFILGMVPVAFPCGGLLPLHMQDWLLARRGQYGESLQPGL
ncbi:MAG TPA: hypothetical protein PKD12_01550 [Nitrospira sp.]|nr:hypothetical protein [Nitrospira sp.]